MIFRYVGSSMFLYNDNDMMQLFFLIFLPRSLYSFHIVICLFAIGLVAIVPHRFDSNQSPAYGKKYNDLVKEAVEDGRVKITGCPDRI